MRDTHAQFSSPRKGAALAGKHAAFLLVRAAVAGNRWEGLPYKTVPLPHQTVPLPHQTVPLPHQTVPLPHKTVPLRQKTVPLSHKTVPLPHKTVPLPHRSVPLPQMVTGFEQTMAALQPCLPPEPQGGAVPADRRHFPIRKAARNKQHQPTTNPWPAH